MLKHILIPLDGSDAAEVIVGQMRRLLALEVAQVTLLRVIPTAEVSLEGLAMASLIEKAEAAAKAYLVGIRSQLLRDGLVVRTRVAFGQPAEKILAAVGEVEASLLAMATHGRSGVSRWLLGSVAERVLRASPVPVLLMRSFVADPGGALVLNHAPMMFERILVPIDGSPTALGVVPHAAGLARRSAAAIDVVRAVESETDGEPEAELAQAATAFGEAGVTVRTHRREGAPVPTILAAADELESQLIAMKTHGRTGVRRWVLGSVAEQIIRKARLPMLVVRAGDAPVNEWSTIA